MTYTIWTGRLGEGRPVLLPKELPVSAPKTLKEWKAAADRLLNNPKLDLEWVEVRKTTGSKQVTVYRCEVLDNEE